MLTNSDMKKILENASANKKISKNSMEKFEKGRACIDKYFSLIQNGMGDSLKDKKFLYATGEVKGLLTKKFEYAILFSADTFYFFTSSKYSDNLAIKYSDISKVSNKSIYINITLKNKKRPKTSCYMATEIAALLAEVVNYVQAKEGVVEEVKPAPKKKTTTKKATEAKAPSAKTEPKPKTKPKTEKVEAPKEEPKAEAKSKTKKASAPKAEKPKVEKKPKTVEKPKTEAPKLVVNAAKRDDSRIEKLYELAKLSYGEVEFEPLADAITKFGSVRGVALLDHTGLMVAEDTTIRSRCRDLKISYSLMKRIDIYRALIGTNRERLAENLKSNAIVVLFNDLKSFIDLFDTLVAINRESIILGCQFEDELISVEEAFELGRIISLDRAFTSLNIDRKEIFDVVVNRYIMSAGSCYKFGEILFNFNTQETNSLNGELPATVLSGANAYDALVMATLYARNGYEVDVVDSNGVSIFDRTDYVKTQIVDLPDTDRKVQVICVGEYDQESDNSQTGETEIIIDTDKDHKVQLIKEIKNFMGWSLLEAKTFIDECPKSLVVDKDPSEIGEFVDAFKRIGGRADIVNEKNVYIKPVYIAFDSGNSPELCGYTIINRDIKFFGESAEITQSVNEEYGYKTQGGNGEFWLIDFGGYKIEVIKVVKEITGLGLKETKELVEKAPVMIAENLDSELISTYKKQFEKFDDVKVEVRGNVKLSHGKPSREEEASISNGTQNSNEYRAEVLKAGDFIIVNNALKRVTEAGMVHYPELLYRVSFVDVRTHKIDTRDFRVFEKVTMAFVNVRSSEYLYNDGDDFFFMDTNSFEQIGIPSSVVGDARQFLIEGAGVKIMYYDEEPYIVAPPAFVTFTVESVSEKAKDKLMRSATIETGAIIKVPANVEPGDRIKINTRTGEFVEKV